jgi:hypothetical protein
MFDGQLIKSNKAQTIGDFIKSLTIGTDFKAQTISVNKTIDVDFIKSDNQHRLHLEFDNSEVIKHMS